MSRRSGAAKAKAKERRARKLAERREVARQKDVAVIADLDGSDGGPVRPTPRQLTSGTYLIPSGQEKAERPALNMRPDCIAALMIAPAHLDAIQHDAARNWQELRAAVKAEMGGPSQGRSCLDIGMPGYDSGDGDVALADYWRAVRGRLGPARLAVLDRTCVEGTWPRDMDALTEALDAFAVVHGRAG